MNRSARIASSIAAALASAALLASPALADGNQATAHFVAGQTDGLRSVNGTETFTQGNASTLAVSGSVSGLAASTSYVTVAYTDPYCTPTPGVTAFPSGPFTTDASGAASFSASVNPKSINPLATLTPGQIKSISIRQLIVGSPIPGVPNVPNVAAVETCDKNPTH